MNMGNSVSWHDVRDMSPPELADLVREKRKDERQQQSHLASSKFNFQGAWLVHIPQASCVLLLYRWLFPYTPYLVYVRLSTDGLRSKYFGVLIGKGTYKLITVVYTYNAKNSCSTDMRRLISNTPSSPSDTPHPRSTYVHYVRTYKLDNGTFGKFISAGGTSEHLHGTPSRMDDYLLQKATSALAYTTHPCTFIRRRWCAFATRASENTTKPSSTTLWEVASCVDWARHLSGIS